MYHNTPIPDIEKHLAADAFQMLRSLQMAERH